MANEEVFVPPIGVTPPSVPVLFPNYRLVSLKNVRDLVILVNSPKIKFYVDYCYTFVLGTKEPTKPPFMANPHIIIPLVCLVARNRQ